MSSLVSIPYGSIKRCRESIVGNGKKQFQFLMVRLKVFSFNFHNNKINVSIPYGSIKSYNVVK